MALINRSRKPQANKGDQVVQFRMRDAQRIASVVSEVEAARRPAKGSRIPRGFGVSLRLGKTQSAWTKGQSQMIPIYSDGEPPNEAESAEEDEVEAWNKFADVDANKWVMLGSFAGRWYLISAEC